jgi:protein-disulfide isomerase
MENQHSEEIRQEENRAMVAASASGKMNPYVLPASILIAALIIGGSIIYLVKGGGGGGNTAGKNVNPLSLPYKGGKTAFSECVDSKKYAATAQADNAAGGEAGVNSTPTTFVNGKKVVDANGNSVGANGQAILDAIDAAVKKPAAAPKTGPLALTSRDVILGNANAPVTVSEYGDYQWPFCELFSANVQPLIDQQYVQTGKANFVFRNFPFLGPESLDAGAAVECAKDSGKFWEYHNALYAAKTEDAQKYGGGENDGFLNRDMFLNLAQKVGVK